jgi:hypothetical protein
MIMIIERQVILALVWFGLVWFSNGRYPYMGICHNLKEGRGSLWVCLAIASVCNPAQLATNSLHRHSLDRLSVSMYLSLITKGFQGDFQDVA